MSAEKRIACFFTAGYTELQAMKTFMKKINDGVAYIQLCPTQERRNSAAIKNRHMEIIRDNGMTGEKLIDFIVDFIQTKRFTDEKYDAILIEDDKDDRFLISRSDGSAEIDMAGWEKYKTDTRMKIKARFPDLPVVFIYAAPEVEGWFLADWDNSFGKVYRGELTTGQNEYFSTKFRKYVNEMILTDQYRYCIERYGYFGGIYRKISEELQKALDETDFLEGYMSGTEHPTVRYLKKNHGKSMLEQIEPETVLQNCTFFFRDGFWELKAL